MYIPEFVCGMFFMVALEIAAIMVASVIYTVKRNGKRNAVEEKKDDRESGNV